MAPTQPIRRDGARRLITVLWSSLPHLHPSGNCLQYSYSAIAVAVATL